MFWLYVPYTNRFVNLHTSSVKVNDVMRNRTLGTPDVMYTYRKVKSESV